MAATVLAAFNEFQRDYVNLDPDRTRLARRSQDWLYERIRELPDLSPDFPKLYSDMDIAYGSFSRRTKIRPLDDIDMISCLHASGATYEAYAHDDVRITVPDGGSLRRFCHDNSSHLNSRKIINRYVRGLEDVPQYGAADINRRGEAATLSLRAYEWTFDIVPAFHTTEELDGRTYYLIPNGAGHWKKTDPRVDRDWVGRVDARHHGNMVGIVRAMKYWQLRATMPTIPSYLLECIVVDFFDRSQVAATQYVDLHMEDVLRDLQWAILRAVADPKGIATDINDVDVLDRLSVSERARLDAERVALARAHESNGEHRRSLSIWRDIFGDEFPEYG